MPKLLVIDDEFGVAEILESLLLDEGHEVMTAVNGKQGLERLAQSVPDVVFVDFMMPVLDGPGLIQAMRAEPAWAAIPVILMSSLPEDAVSTPGAGYTAFLRKPFRIATVLATLHQVLRSRDKQAL